MTHLTFLGQILGFVVVIALIALAALVSAVFFAVARGAQWEAHVDDALDLFDHEPARNEWAERMAERNRMRNELHDYLARAAAADLDREWEEAEWGGGQR